VISLLRERGQVDQALEELDDLAHSATSAETEESRPVSPTIEHLSDRAGGLRIDVPLTVSELASSGSNMQVDPPTPGTPPSEHS